MPDGRSGSSGAATAGPPDLRFYGTATPSQTNALVLPKQAREELALDGKAPVFVFGSPSQQQAILAASPPPADLMALLAGAAAKRRSGRRKTP
jgi:hypothetical protein